MRTIGLNRAGATHVEDVDRPRSRDARTVPRRRARVDRGDARQAGGVPAARPRARHPRRPGAVRRGDRAARVEPLEQLGGRAAARRAGRPDPSRDHRPAAARRRLAAASARTTGPSPAAAPRAAKPLLAGDPHLLVAQPGTWFELHLRAPGYDARGVALPFLPGIVLGATPHHAWTATNVTGDSQDLFEERLNDDGTAARFGDAWEPLTIHEEPIVVRGDAEPARARASASRGTARSSRTASRARRRPRTGRSNGPTRCDGPVMTRRFVRRSDARGGRRRPTPRASRPRCCRSRARARTSSTPTSTARSPISARAGSRYGRRATAHDRSRAGTASTSGRGGSRLTSCRTRRTPSADGSPPPTTTSGRPATRT